MKRTLSIFCSCAFLLTVVSCGDTPEVDYVRFYNYDGTVLWKTEYYDGMILTYEGESPVRPSDDVYNYYFAGWNHSFSEVKDYRNYYALYEKEIRSFTVTFRDYNGSILKTVNIRYGGNAAVYAPGDPKRENELRKHYYFSHWDGGDLTYIIADTVFTAVYDSVNCYEVRYYDYDGQIIKSEYLEEGSDSQFEYNSFREADENHFYVFDGWDVNVVDIHQDMMVTATYRIVNACTVTFLNFDGSLLSTSKVPSGYNAKYNGPTPFRSSTTSGNYRTDYIFSGWNKSLDNVQSSFSTTAQFRVDHYDYIYRSAFNTFKSFCTIQGTLDGSTVYQGSIYSGYEGSIYVGAYATYRPSDNALFIDYFTQAVGAKVPSRLNIYLYLPNNEPGKYGVYYTYHCVTFDSAGLSFFGYAYFTSSFSKYTSSITFEEYTNLGTTSLSDHESLCAGLINSCLIKASENGFFDAHALGFVNY